MFSLYLYTIKRSQHLQLNYKKTLNKLYIYKLKYIKTPTWIASNYTPFTQKLAFKLNYYSLQSTFQA
jgi:hypothetical protein